MALSVAVCGIFNVKEWPDLESRIRVCSNFKVIGNGMALIMN